MTDVSFDFGHTTVGELDVSCTEDEKGKKHVQYVLIDGDAYRPTDRFWISFFSKFGLSDNVFKYFDHNEVFERISDRAPSDSLRFCVEKKDGRDYQHLLAVTAPTKPLVRHEALVPTLEKYGGMNIDYHQGMVSSTHVPRIDNQFDIFGEKYNNRFVMETPIDGFGKPNIYLSLLRQICLNGAIGYAKAFRSALTVGKNDDCLLAVERALDGFDNDEGYAALRQRFESAAKSWASLYEARTLYDQFTRARTATGTYKTTMGPDGARISTMTEVLQAFHETTGNVMDLYGVANPDVFSAKKQRTLPVKCRVYDLLTLASEVATHYTRSEASKIIQGWVGGTVSNEYDLEGTCEEFPEFDAFYVNPKEEAA